MSIVPPLMMRIKRQMNVLTGALAAALTLAVVGLTTDGRAFVGIAAAQTGPGTPGAADRKAIQQVISTQLSAFRRDDAQTAFRQAAPIIQHRFQTVENFMAMVRSGYRPVYRARNIRFGRAGARRGGVLQEVMLTGPQGRRWIALYAMQRQPDGSWRIAGCRLVQPQADI